MTFPTRAAVFAIARNVSAFLATFFLSLGAFAGLNALGDPYADFYFLFGGRRPNVRTLDRFTDLKFKIRLVREAGRDGLDAAIFGSSRVMRIDPSEPAWTALSPRTLNLGVQGARLGVILEFAEFVARYSPNCRLLIGLDLFAFNESPPGHSIHLDERDWPAAWRAAWQNLGTNRTLPDAWQAWRGVAGSNRLLSNGLAVRARAEAETVHAQLERFAEADWRTWQHFRDFHYDPSKVELLRALKTWHPRAVFFVNPVSRWYRTGQAKAGIEPVQARWLADLATVGSVVDFTEAKEITDDARYYYDMHHYDTAAGALLLRDLAAYLRGEPLRYGHVLGALSSAP